MNVDIGQEEQLAQDINQMIAEHWDPITEALGFALAKGVSITEFAHELIEDGIEALIKKYEG
jgi:hypothetical protein